MKKSIKNPLFKKVELTEIKGGEASTSIFSDSNPTKTKYNPGDVCDDDKTGWSCDSTATCADISQG